MGGGVVVVHVVRAVVDAVQYKRKRPESQVRHDYGRGKGKERHVEPHENPARPLAEKEAEDQHEERCGPGDIDPLVDRSDQAGNPGCQPEKSGKLEAILEGSAFSFHGGFL